jgi:nucleoside diphosphate kinase
MSLSTEFKIVLVIFMALMSTSEAAKERTFVMCKPDAVQRGLVGEIISRYEARGMKLVAIKFMKASRELLEAHYGVRLSHRDFFSRLLDYMSSGVLHFLCKIKTLKI